jgi:glyoxylase-like metal-dependent hydrolase (beta-lactamase superfamily II)
MANRTRWERVRDGIFRYQDSCVVYALDTGRRFVVVNAGTGAWIDSLDELPGTVEVVILTHFFRDHSAGAARAASAGMDVWASLWEQEQLADPIGLFARRETYIIYDNQWDLFAPVEPIPVTRWLRDWDTLRVGDATITIVPTPGVSVGAISLAVERAGAVGVFCGELIHSPGKILRIAPLQYNYNDLPGARNLLYSIHQVRRLRPGFLASSTGPELIEDPEPALDELAARLTGALLARGIEEPTLAGTAEDALTRITLHLYQSRFAEASTYFLLSESGKALAIDYGYRAGLGFGASYPFPRNRRPLLHGLEPLQAEHGIERIDAVLVTHFHDDHVNGIPTLQRLHGTRCLASETFAHILANPASYAFPCTWPEPIDVTPLANGVRHRWEEYEIELVPISGHTRFATLVSVAVDGERVVATGDQYFFRDFEHPGTGPAMHNHVYRNGAVLSSFRQSQEILERLRPTIILPGHGVAYRVPNELLEWTAAYRDEYESIHTHLMPLGDDEIHFNVDSRAAWVEPYRIHVPDAGLIELTAHVRNPCPAEALLRVKLVVPAGWQADEAAVTLPPRGEGRVALRLTVPAGTMCRRLPIALELSTIDRSFGQVAEALVTVGQDRF